MQSLPRGVRSGLVGVGIVATGLCLRWWFYLRRTAPRLTVEEVKEASRAADLRASPQELLQRREKKSTGVLRVIQRIQPAEMEAIMDAFMSSTEMRWIADIDRFGPEVHRQLIEWMMPLFTGVSERWGHVLAVYDSDGSDSTFLGAACIMEPNHPSRSHYYDLAAPHRPPFMSKQAEEEGWGDVMGPRFEAFAATIEGARKRALGTEQYWYICVLGAAPAAQRRGVGGTLLRAVQGLAARDAVPIYLECHADNVAYYEGHGFRAAERCLCTGPGVDEADAFPYFAMVWRADQHPQQQQQQQ